MEQRIAGYCTLCRSRCGSITVVEDGRMTGVEPLPGHPTGGALCAKGRAAPEMVDSPKRLKQPMRRTSPKEVSPATWAEITWNEALDEVAGRLGAIRQGSGAEAVAFAVTTPSGTPMVDSFEWVERFIRCFGSPNLIYATEICGWHKDHMHALTFGRGVGSPDYERAEVIVLWGHNPARTWLAQATRVADARRRGARVAVVDPKPEGSGQQADLWLRIRPGADAALAMGAIRHLLTTGTYDKSFVTRWTNASMLVDVDTGLFVRLRDVETMASEGADHPLALDAVRDVVPCDTAQSPTTFDRHQLDAEVTIIASDGRAIHAKTAFRLLREAAEAYTPTRVAELTWLDAAALEAFFMLFENSPRLAYHSWTGVGQHTNATMTERAIASLYALTGACDRSGGNLWPVPPPTRAINDLSLLPPGQREKALGLASLPLGPPTKGWITARDFRDAVLDGKPYRVRALMSFGTNFAVSQADTTRNLAALRALDFHVHADMFMNPTAECADIILPVGMPWERDALRIGFEITQEAVETIQFRPRMLPRYHQSRSDIEIVCDLARRLGFDSRMFGGDVVAGWNHQLEPLGLTLEEVKRHPAGLRVPQPFGYDKYTVQTPNGSLGFATPTRRVELYSERMLQHGYEPLPGFVEPVDSPFGENGGYPFVLTTAKSGWFVHSSHRAVATLRRKSPDPAVEVSPRLAAKRGLAEGDWAILETLGGKVTLRVRFNHGLDDRVVVAEFGWWEGCEALSREGTDAVGSLSSSINAVLSDAHRDPVSGSVPLRAVLCELRSHALANRGRWSGERRFVVTSARAEGPEVMVLELAPGDGGHLPSFRPGQHVVLRVPDGLMKRSYSLIGCGAASDVLPIAVRRQGSLGKGGAGRSLSRRLHGARAGDEVLLEQPCGIFTPPTEVDRPLVFLAAGIGVTPFLSHLEALAAQTANVSSPEVLLFHGCRSGAEHPFASRLAELDARLPRLRRVTAYSAPLASDRPGQDFDHPGRIDVTSVAALVDRRPLVYLCGSPGFVSSLTARVRQLGVPAFDILAEAFASPAPVPSDLTPRFIRFAGSDKSFLWSRDAGSVLDAAQAAGLALPSGCRVGQCGSCSLRIVRGQVAHLGGIESQPDHCLTCQAVPLSELTLAL